MCVSLLWFQDETDRFGDNVKFCREVSDMAAEREEGDSATKKDKQKKVCMDAGFDLKSPTKKDKEPWKILMDTVLCTFVREHISWDILSSYYSTAAGELINDNFEPSTCETMLRFLKEVTVKLFLIVEFVLQKHRKALL